MSEIFNFRSLLFIPATSSHLLAKAADRGADALVVDLEDGVSSGHKAQARRLAAQAVAQLAGETPVLVRVNSGIELLQADLDALPLSLLQGILLPKVESAAQVVALADMLARRSEGGSPALPIAALIETPLGVLRVESIAGAHASLGALGFGAEDYATAMRIEPLPEAMSWPAHAVSNGAAAFGLACWGLPGSIAEIQDMNEFASLVQRARRLGFSGTLCIHPRQVAVANAGFGPSQAELAWALRLVSAAQLGQADGQGVIAMDGRMIDRPVVDRAKRLVDEHARRLQLEEVKRLNPEND